MHELSLIETRVLGVLAEKQRTVPDTYPMTLNTLASGCNQKTSRAPVMNATQSEVQAALDSLTGMGLAMETSGGRGAARYAHNLGGVLQVPSQSAALLTVLMLRGPQTAGELRIGCDRLHHFADISAVEGFLAELAIRPAGALVVELPRLPGARENRWAHTLGGSPVQHAPAQPVRAGSDVPSGEVAALRAELARLDAEVGALKSMIARINAELGIASESE